MREIILDTETTGLDARGGDRIVEIACLELENRIPTGTHFQRYVNPERDMPEGAFRVHGLSAEFLAGHPVFAKLVDDFLEFIAEDPLVIHNAEFDLRFLNAELKRLDRPSLTNRAIDSPPGLRLSPGRAKTAHSGAFSGSQGQYASDTQPQDPDFRLLG